MVGVKRNLKIKDGVLFRGPNNKYQLQAATVYLHLNSINGFQYDLIVKIEIRYNPKDDLCIYILQGREILYAASEEIGIELPEAVPITSEFKSYKILNGSEILEFHFKKEKGGITYDAFVRQHHNPDLDEAYFIHKGVFLNNVEYRLVKQQVKNLKKLLKEKIDGDT
jgi:hypothetical protein